MRRNITGWYSERLFQDMPLVAYGHFGQPILMLPTAAADFLEYERFQLLETMRPWLDGGKIKAYSVNSVNKQALLNDRASAQEKVSWLNRYHGYITEEVLPLIRHDCGGGDVKPMIFGISLGAYLAGNIFFRRPDLFSGAMLLSGSYDIRNYMNGYYNDDVYFNNPVDFLPHMDNAPLMQGGGKKIIIFTGQGPYEAPDRSRALSNILHAKGVPHWLDVWGHDVGHDWPWWRKCVPYYLEALFGK
jgi:esterase/lipase superfamily enzyme